VEVHCSWTQRQIQERVTGEGVEGSVEAACLASASASSLPGMSVCPGTQWTMMVESVLLMSVLISWMSRAVSYPGPWVRCVSPGYRCLVVREYVDLAAAESVLS
jgi:hypothetical protein